MALEVGVVADYNFIVESGHMHYEIWREGYRVAPGPSDDAAKMGEADAPTFRDACIALLAHDTVYFNAEHLTYFGCKLFDNEADARKRYG